MAVPLQLEAAAGKAVVGTPQPLFTARLLDSFGAWQYAVSRDGQRFLVDSMQEITVPITILVNWKPR
jgi:hypothetical protein